MLATHPLELGVYLSNIILSALLEYVINTNGEGFAMNAPFLPILSIVDPLLADNQILAPIPQLNTETELSPIKRSKIWELKEANRCPIVGTCLSKDELIRFARRFHFEASITDVFLLHVEAVNCVATRNPASEAIQKYLDSKYQTALTRFESAKTDAAVFDLWKKYFVQGEIAGALWAALTHKRISDDTRGKIYADMHMHSHHMGANQAADTRRLAQLEKEYAELETAMEFQKQHHSRIEAKLRLRFQEALAESEHLRHNQKEIVALKARLSAIESGKTMTEMGQRLMKLSMENERLKSVAHQADNLDQLLQNAHNQIAALIDECKVLTTERDALERFLLSDNSCKDSCNHPNAHDTSQLKDCCVVCVGGRIAQLPQYRMLAEQMGVRLTHHDGGQQHALSRLPEMINSADAVICPTDCVSHAAYYQLKRLCKRHGKPCLLFKGKGVASFASALIRLSLGQVSLNADTYELLAEGISK
ncbi:DUF2325 domain-containing protein [Nitrosomonas communis]|uniref:DUF2325 domain-containing protein n=1 Tax=Nitrosomonas communis TaxID=44574 RepID=A0A1H2XU53_9PROT|nr:DUF2325 domain-containing protein [Nitrosomonas communis]SDW96423.1 hypothetical protein SAMN05421882_10433 [Nitrosomonas communis]